MSGLRRPQAATRFSRAAADHWIFVQNTLELYLRVNATKQQAEIAAARPAQGEVLMRIFAATLRPEATP